MSLMPFFSQRDDKLLKLDSVRDYLGLVPVWSKVARKLEPNLSGSIQYYQGLEAVLFIYYLEKNYLTETLESNKSFRVFFRYMEALVEYYLHHHMNVGPCYGSRILKGNGTEVEIKINSQTIVNGLYEFYRGTCRRAGMLSKDWVLDEKVVSTFETLCSPYSAAVNNLVKLIEKKILDQDKAIKPDEVFVDDQIVTLFNTLFESEELKAYIRSCLYVDSELEYYARACSNVKSQNSDTELNLAQHLDTFISADNKQWPYFTKLESINDTEAFLSLLDDCFQLLHLHDGYKLPELVSILMEANLKQIMKDKAANFQRAHSGNGDHDSGRIKLLLIMASLLAVGDVKAFLLALLDYHRSIMNYRGAGAMILLEGDKLHVTFEIHSADKNKLIKSICNKSPWKNSYYINTSARIYNQLHGAK
jgi:hypothetical protein